MTTEEKAELFDLLARTDCSVHISHHPGSGMLPTFCDLNAVGIDAVREQTLSEALRKLKENIQRNNA